MKNNDATFNNCSKSGLIVSYTLPNVITIDNAEQVAADLKQLHLTDKSELLIDASRLERITTPGLQLIVSLEKTLHSQHGTLEIQNLEHPLKVVFREIGLQSLIAHS